MDSPAMFSPAAGLLAGLLVGCVAEDSSPDPSEPAACVPSCREPDACVEAGCATIPFEKTCDRIACWLGCERANLLRVSDCESRGCCDFEDSPGGGAECLPPDYSTFHFDVAFCLLSMAQQFCFASPELLDACGTAGGVGCQDEWGPWLSLCEDWAGHPFCAGFCGSDCNSEQTGDGQCTCDAGYEWYLPDDPSDLRCVLVLP